MDFSLSRVMFAMANFDKRKFVFETPCMLLGSMPRSIVPLAIFTSTSQAKLKNANLMKQLLLWQKGGEHISQIEGTPVGVVCWSNAIFSGKSQPPFTGCDADLDS